LEYKIPDFFVTVYASVKALNRKFAGCRNIPELVGNESKLACPSTPASQVRCRPSSPNGTPHLQNKSVQKITCPSWLLANGFHQPARNRTLFSPNLQHRLEESL